MRTTVFQVIALGVISLTFVAEAAEQRPVLQCLESGSTIATSLDPAEPTISLSPDMRSLAGVSPSVVLNVAVPSGTEPITGEVRLVANLPAGTVLLPLHRAEYWKMGSFPREPVPTSGLAPLEPVDPTGETLYKFYFLVPRDLPAEFEVIVDPLRYKGGTLYFPPTLFKRQPSKDTLLLCPWGVR